MKTPESWAGRTGSRRRRQPEEEGAGWAGPGGLAGTEARADGNGLREPCEAATAEDLDNPRSGGLGVAWVLFTQTKECCRMRTGWEHKEVALVMQNLAFLYV